MSVEWITFSKALEETAHQPRHLLVGNGFSIGADPDFAYKSLVAEACKSDATIKAIFDQPGFTDFERAMRLATDPAQREALKQSFLKSVVFLHKRRDQTLSLAQRGTCERFLAHFLRGRGSENRGRIFTVNYDALIYWLTAGNKMLNCWDGFAADFMWHPRWMTEDRRHPLLWNLHGGLHIYETALPRPQTFKLDGDTPTVSSLIELIKVSVNRGHIPLIVSEGSAQEKIAQIKGHPYLHCGLKKFWLICRRSEDALFIYGHSLSAVDSHITNLIGLGAVCSVYVSVYARGDDTELRAHELSREWAKLRASNHKPPLTVKVFASAEAQVWDAA